MNWITRFRQWCAKPFIDAEVARFTELIEQHSLNCKTLLETSQRAIYQQGYAAGQQYEHAHVFETIDLYIMERDGNDVSDVDIARARNYYQQ